jgi:hypothetical protein
LVELYKSTIEMDLFRQQIIITSLIKARVWELKI